MIKVGGATEVEVKERKDRVDDALNADPRGASRRASCRRRRRDAAEGYQGDHRQR